MEFLIFSTDVKRCSVLENIISFKSPKLDIRVANDLSYLYDCFNIFEYSLSGALLDFENCSKPQIKKILSNLEYIEEKLCLNILSQVDLGFLSNKFNIKRYSTFEEMIFDITQHMPKMNYYPTYTYKINVENSKCYLTEYVNMEETYIKIPILDTKNRTLTIQLDDSYSNMSVVCMVKRLFGRISNLNTIFGKIDTIIVNKNDVIYKFNNVPKKEMISILED